LTEAGQPLKRTPLFDAHRAAGARMAGFGGYDMPIQYEGVLAEHRWTRAHAGLFDVSHMGPARLSLAVRTGDAEADHAAVAALLEPLVSADLAGLGPGRLRYTVLVAEDGGVLDDLMVGRPADDPGALYIVVNAGTKEADFALIAAAAGDQARLERLDDGGLIAIQGPEAAAVAAAWAPETGGLGFMTFATVPVDGVDYIVSRSGYTGEDGFEIWAPVASAEALWGRFLADPRVKPVGLGARDTLRLEAGLPLYGHELDPTVSPIEAGLAFAVSKKRRAAGNLRGGARFEGELAGGLKRVRVGLKVLQGAPARDGAVIVDSAGAEVGVVTSGTFSPDLGVPIALGFVPPALSSVGAALGVVVRGKVQPAEVVPLPFSPHRYVRKS
jgi:aminomethyltransferase